MNQLAHERKIAEAGFCNDCLREHSPERECSCWMQRFSGIPNLYGVKFSTPPTRCPCHRWMRDKWDDAVCGECRRKQ